MRHSLRRRYGHHSKSKTFGKVPVGALFQLKDDPGNALLKKISRTRYKVVRGDEFNMGLTFPISQNYQIKRGRQS